MKMQNIKMQNMKMQNMKIQNMKINDHAAPNLKQSFRLYSEGDTMHDLRNHATDLMRLPKPKREFGTRSFKYNGAIRWNSLPNEAKNANSISTFKIIINSQRFEADSTSS